MARFIENLLQRLLVVDLDEHIGVDEPQGQILGEDDSDGAFAGTRHTDQGEIGFHEAITKRKKKVDARVRMAAAPFAG